jgi:RND family efflux transporter MFP subunit
VSPASSVLFTLMDISRIKVLVSVLEKDLPLVRVGTHAEVRLDSYPGKVFEGTVSRMSGSLDLSTRTMTVEIDIPNPGQLLKPGMYATVSMVLDSRPNALTLPTQAVLKDDKGTFVYVAAGNIAKRIAVTTGSEMEERTEIRSGLKGDEQVITTGQQFVRPNAPIRLSGK